MNRDQKLTWTSATVFSATYGPRYLIPFKASAGIVGLGTLLIVPLWWLNDGDISKYPWLNRNIQSQTHYKEGDQDKHLDVVRADAERRRNGDDSHRRRFNPFSKAN
jgi:hypothetical protein